MAVDGLTLWTLPTAVAPSTRLGLMNPGCNCPNIRPRQFLPRVRTVHKNNCGAVGDILSQSLKPG